MFKRGVIAVMLTALVIQCVATREAHAGLKEFVWEYGYDVYQGVKNTVNTERKYWKKKIDNNKRVEQHAINAAECAGSVAGAYVGANYLAPVTTVIGGAVGAVFGPPGVAWGAWAGGLAGSWIGGMIGGKAAAKTMETIVSD